MATISKYSFRKSPLFDGVIELVKDGEASPCPRKNAVMVQNELNPNTGKLIQPACVKSCPFLIAVEMTLKDGGKPIRGYQFQCVDRPYAIIVDETALNKMEIIK